MALLYVDLNDLVSRIEAFREELPRELASAQLAVRASNNKAQAAMSETADRLIAAIHACDASLTRAVDHEKSSLETYIQSKTSEMASKAVDDEAKTLRKVRDTFNTELDQRVATLNATLKATAERPLAPRMFELAVAGAIGGVFTLLACATLLHFLHVPPFGRWTRDTGHQAATGGLDLAPAVQP